jgi:hypothetical protein
VKDLTCADCGRSLGLVHVYPVRCSCGIRIAGESTAPPEQTRRKPRKPDNPLPCINLGEQVGTADCDCATKPLAYACEIHGICLPRMSVAAAAVIMDDGTRATVRRSCAACGDREFKSTSIRTILKQNHRPGA